MRVTSSQRVSALGLILLVAVLCLSGRETFGQHHLKPTPKTVAWGYYDASTPPVLRIKSGDGPTTRGGARANLGFGCGI